jgi:hypothetical protein
MRSVGPRTSVQGPYGRLSVRLALTLMTLLLLPAESRALVAQLRWQPSKDSRVTGYFVYVRPATMPYGAALDAGAPRPASDGTLSYDVSGLSDTQVYFVAVTAHTATNLESALSNELPIGTPNPCVQDSCVSKTQCTVNQLPDGTACGGPAATQCGATCLAGVCSGLSPSGFSIDGIRLRLSSGQFRVTASGRFAATPSFDPATDGLTLGLSDGGGTPIVQTTLPASAFVGSPDNSSIKLARQKSNQAPLQVRRLVCHTKNGTTRWKLRLTAPSPGGLPSATAMTLQTGSACLASAAVACNVRGSAATCR